MARLREAFASLARGLVALARNTGGNAMPLLAAALVPLLAMIGGGIDMSRGYLVETRLQQACDAGVLGARKRLGSAPAAGAEIPANVEEIGEQLFKVNFRDGSYGSTDLTFTMELENDFSVEGTATAKVPTSIMKIFGYGELQTRADCSAQLSMANTDIVMALDVTGSMAETNSGDTQPKMTILKSTIKSFYNQLEAAKRPDGRIRYGFVPYSTNVNVGGLLEDDWVTDQWAYQSRRLVGTGTATGTYGFYTAASPISGTRIDTVQSTYAATPVGATYTCPTVPANTMTYSGVVLGTTSQPFVGPPAGTETRTTIRRTDNGSSYKVSLKGTTCTVVKSQFVNYILQYEYITQPALVRSSKWQYRQIATDVSNWRNESNGCIEERDTYEIGDYSNVDLTRALDLNIDLVPTPGDASTQWRPMYPELIYGRALKWNGSGSFTNSEPITTTDEYIAPKQMYTDACPPAAQKLAEMTGSQVDDYLSTLRAWGSTYHDVGMIWAGRLISPTGIFAAENADASPSEPTKRHVIFMTDGQTSTLDVSYSSYGIEPVDRRRWTPGSALSLTDTVEARFAFACEEVKKRNVTVWFIAFGTQLNSLMSDCAGEGHSFQADNSTELAAAFNAIANEVGDLRITK